MRNAAWWLVVFTLAGCDRLPDGAVRPVEHPDPSDDGFVIDVPIADTAVETDAPPDTDTVCPDRDGDGFGECDECDDDDPLVYPGAPEICDGKDSDCDDAVIREDLVDGSLQCATCEATGYWAPLLAMAPDDDLLAVLATANGGIFCEYGDSTDFMFLELDNDNHEVEGVYTGVRVEVVDDKPSELVMNTEHSWPQSLGAGAGLPKCDLHHLYPTDSTANEQRGNSPFGVVTGSVSWSGGGSRLGIGAGGETVFEPRDVHKGNVGRSMLYFAATYGYPLTSSELALYQGWHAADGPDSSERARTEAIMAFQGNANPFVACPWVVEELVDEDFTGSP